MLPQPSASPGRDAAALGTSSAPSRFPCDTGASPAGTVLGTGSSKHSPHGGGPRGESFGHCLKKCGPTPGLGVGESLVAAEGKGMFVRLVMEEENPKHFPGVLGAGKENLE